MLTFLRRLLAILSHRERFAFFALVAMTIVMGFLDALSIASVIPFLAVLLDPTAASKNPAVVAIGEALGTSSTRSLVLSTAYILIFFTLSSIAFRIFTIRMRTHFTNMRAFSFQRRLIEKYLSQPYAWFVNTNSSNLGKSILSEAETAVMSVIKPSMELMAAVATVTCIGAMLVISNPKLSMIAVGLFGLCYLGIYVAVRPRLSRNARIRFEQNARRFKLTQEAFGSVKDVKLMELEHEFLRRFERPALAVARVRASSEVMSLAPRYAVEGLAIVGALVLVLSLTASSEAGAISSAGETVATMGLFAFAAVRLFPALQTIYRSMAQIRFGMAAFDSLYADLMTPPEGEPPAPVDPNRTASLTRRLELRDVVFAYPGGDRPALRGLSLAIEANTTVAFVGGTGAGKTTLIDVLLGLLEPQEGEIEIDGRRLDRSILRSWRHQIGYVPQHIFLTDDSVAANIAFGIAPEAIDRARIETVARIAKLHDFVVEELPQGYDTLVGERGVRLSGGQRQRIGIARALYRDPAVLVLDEATSALDNLTERAVMDAVETLSRQKTIVMIAHRLSTVRRCDRIFLIEQGRVAASGSYDELLDQSASFKALAEVGA